MSSAAVFCSVRKPRLSKGHISRELSNIVLPNWAKYWRKDVRSVKTRVFRRWSVLFVHRTRALVDSGSWIVLIYNGFTCAYHVQYHSTFYQNKTAVVPLPAHTSDRLQPLDVIVSDPLKQFANTAIDTAMKKSQARTTRLANLGELEVWEAIVGVYRRSLTKENILSRFPGSDLQPLNVSPFTRLMSWVFEIF